MSSLQKYYKYINKMLYHLYNINLQLNIDKCKFKIQLIKYLKFIVKADKRISINFKKIRAIMK